jgi:hypothetical protein
MLYRLIYCSTATSKVNSEGLAQLVDRARSTNFEHDLTGMLLHNSRFFLQSIEGARELVNELYSRISRDPRNQHVVLVKYGQVPERLWPSFQARFLSPTADTQALLRRFATQGQFNPYTMHPDSAERILFELSQLDD